MELLASAIAPESESLLTNSVQVPKVFRFLKFGSKKKKKKTCPIAHRSWRRSSAESPTNLETYSPDTHVAAWQEPAHLAQAARSLRWYTIGLDQNKRPGLLRDEHSFC
jgi:hypothetical protein